MSIPEEFIQDLKNRIDIVSLVGSYVTLKRAGRNMLGLCPFHNEKTPSFVVSKDRNTFHCFGCGVGGDAITFVRRIENLDYVDAIRFLAQREGLEVPESGRNDGLSALRNRIYEANREAARFYHKYLYSPNGSKALAYLRNRGLTEKTIVHFGLGYSPPSRFELVNYLKEKGFSHTELIQANLANESQQKKVYDRFSDRVMFPIIDLRGNVIAFGGRIMSDIKPKYLNTSDTPAFNKSRNLYALQFAKNKTTDGQLILVEGYMDVIALHQAGFENTVATLGTSLTTEQANIIAKYGKEVIICYDADNAGQNASARAIEILRKTGIKIKVLTVPDGKDPDEFIKAHGENGAARFRLLIEKCGNDIEYQIAKLQLQYDLEQTDQKVAFLTETAKIFARLDNAIERDAYVTKLSEELNIDKNAILAQIRQYARQNSENVQKQRERQWKQQSFVGQERVNPEKKHRLRAANAEEALLAILMTHPDAAQSLCQKLPASMFLTSFHRRVYEVICRRAEQGLGTELSDIAGDFSVDEVSVIHQMAFKRPRETDPFRAADEYIRVLEEEGERMTPEQVAQSDMQTLMEQLQKMKEKKK